MLRVGLSIVVVVLIADSRSTPITRRVIIDDDEFTFCEVLAIYALSPLAKFAAGASVFNNSTTEPDPEPVTSKPLTSKLR